MLRLPRLLARINRRVINPVQRPYAGIIPGHGIIEHRGRRSGREYRTPVLVFRTDEGFAIIVGYGIKSDWVQNLVAAGGGKVVHGRREYRLSRPLLLRGEEAYQQLPTLVRRLARVVGVDAVMTADATSTEQD